MPNVNAINFSETLLKMLNAAWNAGPNTRLSNAKTDWLMYWLYQNAICYQSTAIEALLQLRGAHSVEKEVSQCHLSSGSDSVGVPPGFNPLSCRVGLANEQPQVQVAKRVTRSQTKKRKGSVLRRHSTTTNCSSGKARKEGSHSRGDSVRTTESMRKIANEAIEIGEMLGLRIVSKKEIAVKRLTRSLKSKKTWKLMKDFDRTGGGHGCKTKEEDEE